MRSPKLTPAITAAAALLALAPAGALAAKNHHEHTAANTPAGGCKVTLRVEKHVLTAGESALAFGLAKCGKAPATGQSVTLFDRPAGASGFSAVGSPATVDEKGGYSVPTGVLTSNTGFYAVLGSVHSAERSVKVASQVTLLEERAILNGVRTGKANSVTFKGTVNPSAENDEVVLQRQNLVKGIGWTTISKGVKLGASGEFSIPHTFRFPGASNVRVVLKRSAHNITSPSNELSFTISQAENPALDDRKRPGPGAVRRRDDDPGAASGLANTPITLLGHTVGGKFAPVATASTNAEGKYSFPVKPGASTLYRVESGGRKSAVLYQGVKYMLTASLRRRCSPASRW